jgi:colanic acid biosynthesis glycosyl transferase WcaI
MRILIIGLNFAPELTGIGKYTGEMAEWLTQQGYQVTAITTPPYYPQWRVARGYSALRYQRETIKGVRVIRCPVWVPRHLTLFRRLLHLLSFSASSAPVAIWKAWRERPDVVMVIQPSIFSAPIGWLSARFGGSKSWLHIQDDEIEAAFELGFLRGERFRRFCWAIERTLLNRFDYVSSISQTMLDQLKRKGVRPGRHILFPNWVDTRQIFPLPNHNSLRERLGFGADHVIALYSGNMGRKQGLGILLDAADHLKDHPTIKIVLCGEGPTRDFLLKKAASLPNVFFMPLQPVELLNELLNMADIHLLIQSAQGTHAFMPSKLLGMLASGRAVIATALCNTPIAAAIETCGILVPPGDSRQLADAILQLSADADRRARMGQEGRHRAVTLWHKDELLSQVVRQLNGSSQAKHKINTPHTQSVVR